MSIPDPATALPLGDGRHALAWCVDDDGEPWPWVVARRPGPDDTNGCCCATHAPHDQLGPLPAGLQHKLDRVPHRCGRRCTDGHACRTIVGAAGRACGWHRTADEARP